MQNVFIQVFRYSSFFHWSAKLLSEVRWFLTYAELKFKMFSVNQRPALGIP